MNQYTDPKLLLRHLYGSVRFLNGTFRFLHGTVRFLNGTVRFLHGTFRLLNLKRSDQVVISRIRTGHSK